MLRLSGLFWLSALVLVMGGYSQSNSESITLVLEDGLDGYSGTRDTTLYQEGALSNGAGQHIFAGTTMQNKLRRALIAFDLSAIPPGSVIQSASFQITISKTPFARRNADVMLHRLVRDWGEGEVDTPGEEGRGTTAEAGNATWSSSFLDTADWDNEGGDFIEEPSATARARGIGSPVIFESEQLAADIQAWIDGTLENYGWAIVSEGQAKRYHSSDSDMEMGLKPRLIVIYMEEE